MAYKVKTLRTISFAFLSVLLTGYIVFSIKTRGFYENIRNALISSNYLNNESSVAIISRKLGNQKMSTDYKLNGTGIKHCFHLSYKLQSLEILRGIESDTDREEGLGARACKSEETERASDRKKCQRFVAIGSYMGRMGNQMFQIASLIGLAHRYDVIPIIPASSQLNQHFDLPNRFNSKESKITNVVNCIAGNSAMFYNCSKAFSSQANITVHGYLQSWKYFANASDIVRKVFKFKSKHLTNAKAFLASISTAGHQRVCIHVRRGDILSKRMVDKGHVAADLDYIGKAQDIFIRKYKKVQFIVVSDDKPWCRKNIKNVTISSLNDPGDEMALMVLSDHVIMTVGTYGWWGAWLSRGTTVYFNTFVKQGSALASRISSEDYFPSTWIGIS